MYKDIPFNIDTHPNIFAGHVYALDITTGKIPSSKYTYGACKRYLRDLKNDKANFYFNPDYAERYLRLVQKFEHTIGHWPTKNIVYDPWQKFVWMNIMGFFDRDTNLRRFRIAHVEVARGNGKALCLDTDIPTPDRGIIKFRDIEIGDKVYGSNGLVCDVIGKNNIHTPNSYRINFSDGSSVDCSDNHLWVTSNKKERETKTESVKTTKDIFISQKMWGESNHSVKLTKPVQGELNCQLPYVLGYWLGDGNTRTGKFSSHVDQLPEIVSRFKSKRVGVKILTHKGDGVEFSSPGISFWLRELGVLGNKHIPEKYFLSDEDTRRELLRGLMDSDGTVSKGTGNFIFCNVNKKLALQVRRLVASLGYKSTFTTKKSACKNFTGVAYYITFSTPNTRPAIFGIKKKEDKRSKRPIRYCDKRYITSVEKIENKPMFCIEVNSPDKTFLVTDQYIPTHNSAMASQCSLFFLALDNPNGNMIANVATRKEQARIVLDSSRAMATKAKAFLKDTGVEVLAHAVVHKKTNSIIRALSSDKNGLDGLNDVLAVCDELHVMSREVFDVIYSGMSKRKDSLTLCITTAGFNTDSVGFSQSVYARKVCEGKITDEQFFAIIYCAEEGDDLFSETTWIKANPGLGTSVDKKTFAAKASKARSEPQDLPNFKVKHLNIWLSEMNSFFDVDMLKRGADTTLELENFKGKKCRIGVDVASHIDLSSIGIVFRENDQWNIFDKSYIPEATVEKVNSDIYRECIGKGYLTATPGEAIDQDSIEAELTSLTKLFKVMDINLDPWNTVALMQRLQKKRIPTNEFRMTVANLSEPMKVLDAAIRKGQVRYNGSPLLNWSFGNVVAKRDAADNVFPRKTNDKLKIDPVIAILMAVASWIQDEQKESIYESKPFRYF